MTIYIDRTTTSKVLGILPKNNKRIEYINIYNFTYGITPRNNSMLRPLALGLAPAKRNLKETKEFFQQYLSCDIYEISFPPEKT